MLEANIDEIIAAAGSAVGMSVTGVCRGPLLSILINQGGARFFSQTGDP